MVIFIFARTIGINGFLMVLGLLNHYLKLIFSPQTIAFNGFSMVLGSFNHWFQWFSMVMDHWSNNAMVLMDHSPLNFHKIENFKLADPAVEGDPGIWHRSFWLSAVTLNKHKSMCALPLP